MTTAGVIVLTFLVLLFLADWSWRRFRGKQEERLQSAGAKGPSQKGDASGSEKVSVESLAVARNKK